MLLLTKLVDPSINRCCISWKKQLGGLEIEGKIETIQTMLDIYLKISFDMPRKLCGWHARRKLDTWTKNIQEIDLFPKVNSAQVFLQRRCRVNYVDGMPSTKLEKVVKRGEIKTIRFLEVALHQSRKSGERSGSDSLKSVQSAPVCM